MTVTRQFPYDPDSDKTLDLALLVNGIPTATAELKNPLTGQTVEHAIRQYRTTATRRTSPSVAVRWSISPSTRTGWP